MVGPSDLDEVVGGLRRGDEDAAAEIHRRFAVRLVALANRQFDTWLRHRADPEGAVQSAFASFFARCGRGMFDLGDWDALWRLLALITVRKCRRRYARLKSEKRDAAREVVRDDENDLLDREPTPEEGILLAETLDTWRTRLHPRACRIVELGLGGASDPEIARQLLCSERSVRRLRAEAERQLIQMSRELA